MKSQRVFTSFAEFYPFYLSEHQNRTNRILHFIGSWLVIFVVLGALLSSNWLCLLLAPVAGYGLAWIGHFVFERNRPATFSHPFYSLAGDWVMFWQLLTGQLKF